MSASPASAADAPALVLEHLTTADGLPQATVMTTLQDSRGFVWFGTEDGLVRYDGEELHRYAKSRSDENSLPGNFIWDIAEDASGDLWIAVKDGGLARWSRSTDRFVTYRHQPREQNSLASDQVRKVLIDVRGLVWIGTSDAGVDILDPISGHIEHLRHREQDAASLSDDHVFTLSQSRSGGVWIGTQAGLDYWQPQTRAVTRFGPARGVAGSLSGKQVSQVLEDDSGVVWVGTFDSGLLRLDREGRVLQVFSHDGRQPDSLASDDVRALLEDQAGRLWVGTAGGLDLLDRVNSGFSHYAHDTSDGGSLRDSFVMSLYQDPAGLIWVGTRTGGVSRWNPRSWELGGHRPQWLGSEPVTAFADASGGRAWIASLGAGLVLFDADTGEHKSINALIGARRAAALSGMQVMSLRQDSAGTLWIGTMSNGLKKLTGGIAGHARIESIPVTAGDPHATSAAGIMNIVETRSGQLWIGTFGGGANVLDPATGSIRQLPFDATVPGALSAPIVTAIAEDSRGNLWIGTDSGGLNLARPDGSVVKVFKHDPHDVESLPANTIYAVAVGAQDQVWLATDGGGLVKVLGSPDAPDQIRFEVLTRAEGLSSDTLYAVVADASGNLWLSGNAGLMLYDPASKALKTYHRQHGLQGEEFSFGAHHRLRDGRLCFGGPGGFNIFDPTRLTESRQPPRLALTNVEVLGARMPSATPYWELDHIALDYRGSIVSLDFGVFDFSSPRHNRLAYRLPGLAEQWIDLGAQRRITLTNLDAGEHLLEVRAANADSVWNPEPLRLTLHRDPAPWKSRWAYACYVLLVLGTILHRVRRHRLKFREMAEARERLETEVQLRTRELVQSNHQLAEAARAKSDFLDRMSHELRTPMNGVVGMTELLSRTAMSATQSHLTKTIRSSAQILLQIVNDLLDLSKIRAGKVSLEALPIDLSQVLEECTSLFAGAAEDKGIELIVCPPPRIEHTLLGDPLRVRQILMNLVGNAVKFTSQGEVVVRADVEVAGAERATARISVSDTGIGMDAAAVSRIFEPFSQGDETTTRRFGGTGLGLAICRELADLMDGAIAVNSKPQIGSTFCLTLPLKLGSATAAAEMLRLPQRRVRILSRRPALHESLSRHAASLGLTVADGDGALDCRPEDIVIVDFASQQDALQLLLTTAESSRPGLVIIATAAEVEAHDLRVAVDEKMIILKPVHRIALQEALAVATGMLPATAYEAASNSSQAQLKGHVLLVEDEPVNAAVAEGYLAELGCSCVWVKTGTDAVARSAAERFDAILMDLNMPDMDGFAATQLVRQREGEAMRTPIIALTAHDAVNYRDKCLKAGMDDILSKPYVLEDCARLLRRWLTGGSPPPEQREGAAAPVVGSLASVDAGAVSALRKLRAGQRADLYTKLVGLFRSTATDALLQLQAALDARDLSAAAAVCHKFSSSAANVGALVFAKQVREIERLCLAGDHAKAVELHASLQAAHAPLVEALLGVVSKRACA